ncbi:MAG: hypothetical protein AABZ53_08895 [Planctomycetota bacterium]
MESTTTSRPRLNLMLCLTAALLGALAATQVGKRLSANGSLGLFESTAQAVMVARQGNITLMTHDVSLEDVLLVLDERREVLLAYRVESMNSFQLAQKIAVPQMFAEARAKALGRN